jgi:TNF receptor-associated protein 1
LAESSPYFEALKKKDVEVLFCYEPYDELVLMQLRQFNSHNLTSVEKEMRQDREPDDLTDLGKCMGTQ